MRATFIATGMTAVTGAGAFALTGILHLAGEITRVAFSITNLFTAL